MRSPESPLSCEPSQRTQGEIPVYGHWSQTARIQIPAAPPISSVTLGKSLTLSIPHFSPSVKWGQQPYLSHRVVVRSKRGICASDLQQGQAQRKHCVSYSCFHDWVFSLSERLTTWYLSSALKCSLCQQILSLSKPFFLTLVQATSTSKLSLLLLFLFSWPQ